MSKLVKTIVTIMFVVALVTGFIQCDLAPSVSALDSPVGNWQDAGNYSTTWYGDGTASAFTISTAADLAGLAKLVNAGNTFSGKTISLVANIDLAAHYWTPIGGYGKPFNGTFDGQNFVITYLTIDQPSLDWAGLFGFTGSSSVISNLGMTETSINGGWLLGGVAGENFGSITNTYSTGVVYGYAYIGGLVGRNSGALSSTYASGTVTATSSSGGGLVGNNVQPATITNSYASGLVNGDSYLGGLVGDNYKASIIDSYSTANVEGVASQSYLGGLVGMFSGTIERSYATGNISGLGYSGGLVGNIWQSGTITNAYATGSVTGTSHLGGLVGDISNQATITNTYATGAVTVVVTGSGDNVGGLIGFVANGVVTESYWDSETSGQSQSAGGTAKSTQLMKEQATFASWDFTVGGVWAIKSGSSISYPYFQSNAQSPAPGLEVLTFSSTISSTKDGSPWTSDVPDLRLSSSSTTRSDEIVGTLVDGVYTFDNLDINTTYYVWEVSTLSSVYTGHTVTEASKSLTLDYFTLSFDGNGSTSGSMVTKPALENSVFSLEPNTFEKNGFVFTGWNTEADGNGTAYADSGSFTMPLDGETLYAQWTLKMPDTGDQTPIEGILFVIGLMLLGFSELVLKRKTTN